MPFARGTRGRCRAFVVMLWTLDDEPSQFSSVGSYTGPEYHRLATLYPGTCMRGLSGRLWDPAMQNLARQSLAMRSLEMRSLEMWSLAVTRHLVCCDCKAFHTVVILSAREKQDRLQISLRTSKSSPPTSPSSGRHCSMGFNCLSWTLPAGIL
jgi:hypothetical protein